MSWISLALVANAASSGDSSVHFPVTESPQKQGKQPISPLRAPHLPFRRISLPTAPSFHHRVSVVSVASFDSLAEDGDAELSPQSGRVLARVLEQPTQGRSPSVDPTRRRKRARETSAKPTDERQNLKKRKIVEEFYETEKAYVDGLELIYSVRVTASLLLLNNIIQPHIPAFFNANYCISRYSGTALKSFIIDLYFFQLHRHMEPSPVISLCACISFGTSSCLIIVPIHIHFGNQRRSPRALALVIGAFPIPISLHPVRHCLSSDYFCS